jgi:hypothetical protein
MILILNQDQKYFFASKVPFLRDIFGKKNPDVQSRLLCSTEKRTLTRTNQVNKLTALNINWLTAELPDHKK